MKLRTLCSGFCTGLLGGLLGLVAMPALLQAAEPADYLSFQTEDEANNIEIFQEASPAVVFVTTSARVINRFSLNAQDIPQGSGTGFVWDKQGHIVTNFHVIQDVLLRRGSRASITLQDQSSWDATVVGVAPGKDLALLRIDAPAELLTPLPLGDSSLLQVGRKVVAIGNPFGLDTTMTVGVVSALGREIDSLTNRKIRDVIQTDAPINPGNSGGPLLNSLGQLVGVNTQIVSPSGASAGIGFAIPVNTVKKVIPQLLEHGEEVRPVLGVEQVPDNYAREWGIQGVAILEVQPGTPAEQAGLSGLRQDARGRVLLGDIIIEVDGTKIEDNDDLLNALEQHNAGDRVTVLTLRDEQVREVEVVLSAPGEI
jgi:S1-C subfamily serine protease